MPVEDKSRNKYDPRADDWENWYRDLRKWNDELSWMDAFDHFANQDILYDDDAVSS